MSKKKLLCLCDSPTLETGFARVAKNLLKRWHVAGVFEEIWVWAIGYTGFPHPLPYFLCPTTTSSAPLWHLVPNLQRFLSAIETQHLNTEGGFTHLWMLQDTFALEPLSNPNIFTGTNGMPGTVRSICKQLGIKSYLYFPVDAPLEPAWTNILADVDVPVAYCEYGRHEAAISLEQKMPDSALNGRRQSAISRIQVLPHGVESSVYRRNPTGSEGEKYTARKTMFSGHIAPEDFLMVTVAQNQKRKAIWHGLEILKTMKAMRPDLRAKMYVHAASQNPDEGFDLRLAARQLGLDLRTDIFFADKLFERGYAKLDEENLNAIYNVADVLVSTSFGEGWGLPLTEAMCAGTPVAGPSHSAVKELLGDDRGILFNTSGHEIVMGDNSRLRPRTDTADAAQKLINARLTPPEKAGSLAAFAARGQQWARSEYLDWDRIAGEWLKLFGF